MLKFNALILAGVSAALAASASQAGSRAAQDLGVLPGGTWSYAISMNERGQIAGNGMIGGQQHIFLLKPTPEPASLSLIAVGASALLARQRRHRE